MQKLFEEVTTLDAQCYTKFGLTEDILMEHAANGINHFIRSKFSLTSKVIVVCGGGNNGADGIALSRLLHNDYEVSLLLLQEPKSQMAKLQISRANAIGVQTINSLKPCDVLVDAIFGTGFRGTFDPSIKKTLQKMNQSPAYKIACDIPSGLQKTGICTQDNFKADITLTMGALKKSMYSDQAKEFVGTIKVLDLGLSRNIYENNSPWKLLDLEDLKLPFREKKDTHKGSFGHLAVISGEKSGASIISALSALKFGAGLVTLVSVQDPHNIPYSLMYTNKLPVNTTAIASGMGLGDFFSEEELLGFFDNSLPKIIDADLFHMPLITKILEKENLLLTPHPKEFVSLLQKTKLANIDIAELQNNRFKYAELFCKHFPNLTLLLKGANVIIGKAQEFYINPHGTSVLAKGGSGDVLSGLAGALLAQGYDPLQAAIHASLAHTKLGLQYKGTDFSLTPDSLIEGIGNL